MRIDNDLKSHYYNWLLSLIFGDQVNEIKENYSYLFETLFLYDYNVTMEMDKNRADDGLYLRTRFSSENNIPIDYINCDLIGPCSILELMVALSYRIEDTIMYDSDKGFRPYIWFYAMLQSLCLDEVTNINWNPNLVKYRIDIFNNREYDANGKGGLFTIEDHSIDLRYLEIWAQMNLYLNEYNAKLYGIG